MNFSINVRLPVTVGGVDCGIVKIPISLSEEVLADCIWDEYNEREPLAIPNMLIMSCLFGEEWEGLADIFEVLSEWLEKQELDDDQLAKRDQLLAAMKNFMRSPR